MSTSDVFPNTLNTWIGEALDRGGQGRLDVNAHLMQTYAWPLRVYFLGTSWRWLGEPDDIVNGFFANRLGRDDFLQQWRDSGLRLRRWLMNAFCFYLREEWNRRRRRRPSGELDDEPLTFSGDPEQVFDRAAVVAFVSRAVGQAAEACAGEGLEDHWRIFVRHHVDGIPFGEMAGEFGVDAARAAVMARTATRKFNTALRAVLARDGVAREDIDREIHLLLEAAGS